jgi:Ni/Co efflux regulator RcnB
MTRRSLVCAVLALSFFPMPPAAAQGNSNHDKKCRPGHGECNNERGRVDNRRDAEHRPPARYQERNDDSRGDHGASSSHNYHRGDRLPPQYRTYQYVVEDWHGHGLRQPPRGYQWVQSGGDYILVAIATGLILELLLNR